MSDLDNRWAWTQVEAMADGSLDAASAKRMRAAMTDDSELDRAVERAAALRHELARLGRVPIPAGQRRRLLGIASSPGTLPFRRTLRRAAPIGAAAAAAAAAIGLTALLQHAPPPPPSMQARAVSDFETAMTYLHRSAAIAGTEVTAAVGGGLRDALTVGRDAVQRNPRQDRQERKNGG